MLKVVDLTGSSPRFTTHCFGQKRKDCAVEVELRLEPDGPSGLRLLIQISARQRWPDGQIVTRSLPIVAADHLATGQLLAAHQLLEASLMGSGPVPLLVDDYAQVFDGVAGGQLTVDIQPLGWSMRTALPYKRLVAVVFAPVEMAYDEYLAVAVGLQARLPEAAPFKAGLIHRPFQQPMLLLLGQRVPF
ncbi:hypothetical protein [Stutzerimonas frequens]|uniref:hypothetical protein n=1 Tax=Stutzerimonas frequens TaxID=2968969 RepID=UPI0012E1820F|nr:hypothetical protein [Stutzerimonas frequens]MUT70743.1 hypothetical protein [Stutzerimonas frequens]